MKLLSTIILLLTEVALYAQPGGGGPGGGGDPDVPISGIGLLIAVGAFLGIRKLINIKKNQ